MSHRGDSEALLRAMPLVFVLIWSTGFIVARYGMPHAPPLSFLAWRYVFSILCFLPWILLARVAWPATRTQWLHLGVTGVLMHAGYLGGVWAAVKAGMGSGLVALVVGLQPVLTAVWLSASGSSVTRRQWLGLALGFAGLALVVARKFGAGGEATFINLALAVLALLEHEAVRWTDAAGGLNGELLAAMAWSVLGLTLGGSSLLYLLIQRGAATSVTSLLYLVPPTTALMAWVLFSEPITLLTITGTVLTALGVSLVVRPARA